MIVARTIAELHDAVGSARAEARRVGFVPTMGYLHEGHLTLCDVARRHADFVVASIFVNPLQFGPSEDLDRYPRDLQRDTQLAEQRAVDLLFVPGVEELYPDGGSRIRVTAPALVERLCGAFRPGHFEGVLTIVAKLFNLVRADVAVFGQKDLQQAVLVRRMARDLDFGIDVVTAPIVREPDGLAMSSRNIYLAPPQRAAAASLSRALRAAQEAFTDGATAPATLRGVVARLLEAEPLVAVQYIEVVDTDTLDTPERARAGDAVALAAFVGSTRLIDNHILA